MKSRIIPFPYFGGKSPYLDWLYSKFPDGIHLVDAMCGSASVAINASQPLVTINDINDDVVNFFRVLRNDYKSFKHSLRYTPFSRTEFNDALNYSINRIERARRFYVRALQSFGGMGTQNAHNSWGFEVSPTVIKSSKAKTHFRITNWQTKLQLVDMLAERLRNIQIENDDVIAIVNRYDKKNVLIYIDQPYVLTTRSNKKRYRNEFTDEDHIALAERLNDCNAFVAVSGYECELYKEIYPSDKWQLHLNEVNKSTIKKSPRVEALWTNYSPEEIKYPLFKI